MLLYWILLPIVWVLAHIVFRIQVIGRENLKAVRDGRAYVIAPNHIANLDPVLIAITIFDWKRLRILAKEELFKIRWLDGSCAAWARCPSSAARATPSRWKNYERVQKRHRRHDLPRGHPYQDR